MVAIWVRGPKSQKGMDWTTHFCEWWWGIEAELQSLRSLLSWGAQCKKRSLSALWRTTCKCPWDSQHLAAMAKEAAKRNQQKGQWTFCLWFLASEARECHTSPRTPHRSFCNDHVLEGWRKEGSEREWESRLLPTSPTQVAWINSSTRTGAKRKLYTGPEMVLIAKHHGK